MSADQETAALTTQVAFWSCGDGEELSHTDPDEAIQEYLDNMLSPRLSAADVLAVLPKTVTVRGYARRAVSLGTRGPLERLLEDLDEEYGSPDGDPHEITEKMKAAEAAFITVVLAEYLPWACEHACSKEVGVEAWVSEHRPDWLEDTPSPGDLP